MNSEFRSCVKVEVAALGSPSLINSLCGRKTTPNLNAVKPKDLHISLRFEASFTYLFASVPLLKKDEKKRRPPPPKKKEEKKKKRPHQSTSGVWRWKLGTSPKDGEGNYPQMASIQKWNEVSAPGPSVGL